MKNMYGIPPLHEVTHKLSDVAMGRAAADTVILGAKLINVCTREILPDTGVAISHGRIALVGDASHCIGEGTEVIDAAGQYIAPGFLDGHIHVESSMMSVSEYARTVIPHGTTGIYMDPHEICNVLGFRGVECMAEDAALTPLKTMITTPSCVPAVPGFEDTGGSMNAADIAKTMEWQNVAGLGEMMNYPGIIYSSKDTHDIVAATLKAGKTVTGHYSVPETGRGLNAYVSAGIRCCHESTRAEDALAKMRLGMYAMIREGSAWHDLAEVSRAVTQNEIDSRYAVLVSDDAHPHTLVEHGHLDHIVRRAIEEGVDPLTAIQMVTINCAQCFHMDNELGSVTPGKCADIVFFRDLNRVDVSRVLINGKTVSQNGKMTVELERYNYPDWATASMHIGAEITEKSFRIEARGERARVRAIEVIGGKVGNREVHVELAVKDGALEADASQDVLKAVVFERHNATGTRGCGFVRGFGIKDGAMASTVAHDAHNLLVIGTNDADMALAARMLVESGGGLAVVRGGKVLGHVALPIAGLMNDLPAEQMSRDVEVLERAWTEIGCEMVSPFMTMALIPLACLPELRLTNRGLVDCNEFKFVDLILE